MDATIFDQSLTLANRIEEHIRRSTHDRIRNLQVKEASGQVVVSGEVKTWYSKQLALQAALELLPDDRFRERIIVVGSASERA